MSCQLVQNFLFITTIAIADPVNFYVYFYAKFINHSIINIIVYNIAVISLLTVLIFQGIKTKFHQWPRRLLYLAVFIALSAIILLFLSATFCQTSQRWASVANFGWV